MTKTDLIYEVATEAGLTKANAEKAVNALTNAIGDALRKGDKVAIAGFGNFEVSARSARTGRNPQTGEPMEIAASKTVKFKPAKSLKDRIK